MSAESRKKSWQTGYCCRSSHACACAASCPVPWTSARSMPHSLNARCLLCDSLHKDCLWGIPDAGMVAAHNEFHHSVTHLMKACRERLALLLPVSEYCPDSPCCCCAADQGARCILGDPGSQRYAPRVHATGCGSPTVRALGCDVITHRIWQGAENTEPSVFASVTLVSCPLWPARCPCCCTPTERC